MIGIEVRKRFVFGSHAGCSSDSPAPAGMIAALTVILVMMVTLDVALSPFALNNVAKGGSSALLAPSRSVPSVVRAISSRRVVPPVDITCFVAMAGGASRSMTCSVLLPSPP